MTKLADAIVELRERISKTEKERDRLMPYDDRAEIRWIDIQLASMRALLALAEKELPC